MFFDQDPLDPFQPRVIQPLPPQETRSRLEQVGSGLVGGLGYVGDLLDKHLGGRALRGLLGGQPGELLSVLPLSDTLNLTDYKNRVSGKKLLGMDEQADEDGFSWNDAKGIGLEMALDPSMYFGAAVPKLVASGLKGSTKTAGAGLEAVTGKNPYTYAGRQLDKAKVFGGGLFDPDVAGSFQKINQEAARGTYTPEVRAGQAAARQQHLDFLTPVDELAKQGFDPDLILRASTQAAQGRTAEAMQSLIPYHQDAIQTILDAATGYHGQVAPGSLARERASGTLSKIAHDVPEWGDNLPANIRAKMQPESGYLPHNLASPEEAINWGRHTNELSGISGYQMAQDPMYKGLGGIVATNDLFRNPALAGLKRTMSDVQVEDFLTHHLTGEHGVLAPQAWANVPGGTEAWEGMRNQVKGLSERLRTVADVVREKGLFSENMFGGLRGRDLESYRTSASANTIVKALSKESGQVQSIADLQKAGTPYVTLPEFLEKTGLTHVESGVPVAMEKIAGSHQIPWLTPQDLPHELGKLGIPNTVAEDMRRIGQSWQVPSGLKPILNKWDEATQNLKANLTYPFPGFNVRNLATGGFNQVRDSAFSTSAIKQMSALQRGGTMDAEAAAKLFPGMSVEQASKEFRNELMANNIAFTRSNQVSEKMGAKYLDHEFLPGELPGVGGEARGVLSDVGDWAKRNLPGKGNLNPLNSETFFATKAGREAGNAAEDAIRGSHYLAKRMEGLSSADAATATKKYQIDYSNHTQFEKNVMKRLIPFYSFSRGNLPVILSDLADKPAKLAASIRVGANRQEGDFVPEYLGEGTALKLGKQPGGDTRYLSSFGLPFEDEAVKAIGSALHGKGTRALQDIGGMLTPFAKTPIEMASGVQLSTGRKLSDLKQNLAGKASAELGLDEPMPGASQTISELAAGTPASRALTAAGKLVDERKGAGAKLVNLLTGANLTDVDIPKQKQIAVRDEVMKRLEGNPAVKDWNELYIKPEDLSKLSPAEMELYRFYRGLESKGKEDAKKRKARSMLAEPLD